MSGRMVLVDPAGAYIAGVDRVGNVLQLQKTSDPAQALEATPETVKLMEDWQARCRRYGRYEEYRVVEIEQHAVTC